MAAGVQVGRGDAIVVYNQAATANGGGREATSQDLIRGEEEILVSHQEDSKEKQNTVIYILLSLVFVGCSFAAAVFYFLRHQRLNQVRLSLSQRDQLLAELKHWASGASV